MFTGIVQGKSTVLERQTAMKTPSWIEDARPTEIVSLVMEFPEGALQGVEKGGSIALDGVCLTVTSFDQAANTATFDVIPETLQRTTLGQLKVGSVANYERAARIGDEIGGHNVSGHICACGRITAVTKREQDVRVEFSVPEEWHRYILEKGYIAVDGISLTVGEVDQAKHLFCVYLIPETLRVTTLGGKTVDDLVNVEVEAQTQAIVTTVERVLRQKNLV